jgi:hypothetical protein
MSGPAASAYATGRLEFSGADALTGTVRLSNLGALALRLVAGPALNGEHAAQFTITEASCAPDLVLRQDESCTVTIVFRPEAGPGLRVAVLRLAHDWIGAGANIPLIGRLAP